MNPIIGAWIAILGLILIVGCIYAAIIYVGRYAYLVDRERHLREQMQHQGASGQDTLKRA